MLYTCVTRETQKKGFFENERDLMNENTRPRGIIKCHMSAIDSRIEMKNQLQEAIKKSVSPCFV